MSQIRCLQRIRQALFCGSIWLLLVFARMAFGQANGAIVEGIVEDASGARIPDARVKLVSSATGAENRSTTTQDGFFALPGVIPGQYSLVIEREGFATAQISGLTVNSGEPRSLLIRLRIGPVTETVRIDAGEIAVNMSEASVSTTVNREFAANLPLNGRSFEDLFTMSPGVLTDSPQTIEGQNVARGGISINGQRSDMNRFWVDGVSANFGLPDLTGERKFPATGNLLGLTAMGTTLSLASVDALEEFKVLGSTYSAQYGAAPGGQFSLRTRSGSNEFHGTLFDYARNSVADGLDWFGGFNGLSGWDGSLFNHGDISFLPYHQNDFGGALGGPLFVPHVYDGRDRAFFFFSGERAHVFQPTAFWRQFVPNLQVPAPLEKILHDYPGTGESTPMLPPLVPFVSSDSLPGNESVASLRADGRISSRASGFVRISAGPSNSELRRLSSLTTSHIDYRTLTVGANQQISATTLNDFRFGYAENASHVQTALGGYQFFWNQTDLATDLGAPASTPPSRAESYIRIEGIGESRIDVDNASSSLHQWNVRDTVNLLVGRHFVSAGLDFQRRVSELNPAPISIQADFLNADSLVNNRASDIAITRNAPARPVFNEFSAFVQDDWKLGKSLTVSPGVRWEVDPPPHGENGADAYTLLGTMASPTTLRLAPRGAPLWHTSWLNLAPRIGMAWTANKEGNWELVVRAGAGVYFGNDNGAAAEAFNALGFSATNYISAAPVPVDASAFDFSTAPSIPFNRSQVVAFPQHFQLPYSLQWNIGVEQALGRSQDLSASWIAASGQRLVQERRSDVSALNPNFGEVTWFPGGVSSSYQSLQVKFQRSISHGVQALASCVWSHNIDYSSTDPAFPFTRGDSDLDVRHNLQTAISWNQRTWLGNWWKKNLLSGWGLDGRLTARSAYPVNLLGNIFVDPASAERYYSGVDLIPGRPLYLSNGGYPGGRIFNGGPNATTPAFVLPEGSEPGNAPRNIVRGFGDFQLNMAIRRELNLKGSLKLQVRAEAFNLSNHPDLGYIDPHVSDLLFGQAELLLNQSFGSPGSLFQPGGPRSLQFSLRLHF